MCVIVYKPANKKYPTYSTLKKCFDSNPHGAGFMYVDYDKNKVVIEKGFMTYSTFCKALKKHRVEYGSDSAVVMHFRIATSGGVNEECTHPYPLSNNIKDLKQVKCFTDLGIAHNGIIPCCSRGGNGYNDTMKFIKDYLFSLIDNDKKFYKNDDTLDEINDYIGCSKLAIFDNDSHCTLFGKWFKIDGVYYSNTYWQSSYIWQKK